MDLIFKVIGQCNSAESRILFFSSEQLIWYRDGSLAVPMDSFIE